MAGDKKVVIKINIPTSDKKNTGTGSSVREVTEWKIGRLVAAGLMLLLVLAGLLYVFLGSDSDQDESLNANNNEITISSSKVTSVSDVNKNKVNKEYMVEKPASDIDPDKNKTNKSAPALTKMPESSQVDTGKAKIGDEQITHPLVVRAQLALNVINKEPAGEVDLPIVVNRNKARALFYFTELKNMKGKAVYHQWIYNGKNVFKRRINIRGNRWRASTRKMINPNNAGNWSVRLLDQKGRVMNEIIFTVVLSDN